MTETERKTLCPTKKPLDSPSTPSVPSRWTRCRPQRILEHSTLVLKYAIPSLHRQLLLERRHDNLGRGLDGQFGCIDG
jgi:hypothetical protein